MDSVTHIALGACIGEALLGHKIGKKALLVGAFAQSVPDIDFVASFWLTPAQQLLSHRGITHSFLFILLIAPLIGYCFQRLLSNRVRWQQLTIFFLLQMLIHLFLDAFNNYGVGWFEPFSHIRVSFNTIYVADVLMVLVPFMSLVILLLLPPFNNNRMRWAKVGITWTSVYIFVCIFNKYLINDRVNKAFVRRQIPHLEYFTTPAPLQNMLWMVVAGDDKGYYVGYRSVFDSDTAIDFQYFPRNDRLLQPVIHHEEVNLLKRFSQGFYTVEQWNDTLVFNDLRFGQIIGWHDPKERFVFHYFLKHRADNRLVIQRGRFSKWDKQAIVSFLNRIKGN